MGIKFNEQQLEAINHFEGPCAVISGAGSGKSTVLVKRIENLIAKGVLEEEIMAISFTKATATDLTKKLNAKGILNVNVGTFHSIIGRMLFENNINVYNNISKFEVQRLFTKLKGKEKVEVEDILSFISYQKCFMKDYNDSFVAKESFYTDQELRLFFREYEKLKERLGAYDFDDWLLKGYGLLCTKPTLRKPKFLLVDEHQDSNLIQNMIIDKLCPSKNIFVVGDYRQSIYGFRGAVPRYFMEFTKNYPGAKVINLDYNYRSAKKIVEKANDFMRLYYGNYEHYSDSIATSNEIGEITFEYFDSKLDEAEDIANQIHNMITLNNIEPQDIAILFRNNIHSEALEMSLLKRNIPYSVDNIGNFFDSMHIAPIVSILRLIINKHDDEAMQILFNKRVGAFKFLSKAVIDNITYLSAVENISYFEALIKVGAPLNQKKLLNSIYDEINQLTMQFEYGVDLLSIIENTISILGIRQMIYEKFPKDVQEDKLSSLNLLKQFAKNYSLEKFLMLIKSGFSLTKKKKKENSVKLMTIHRSKGLEFDHVFVAGLENDKFPSSKSDITEEARLFYVAVTRSKKTLHIRQILNNNKFTTQYFHKK